MPRPEYRYTENGLDWDFVRQQYLESASADEQASQLRRMAIPNEKPIFSKETKPKPEPRRTEIEPAGPPNAIPPDMVQLILDYYKVGCKISWISKETGVSQQAVRNILKKHGTYEPNRDRGKK